MLAPAAAQADRRAMHNANRLKIGLEPLEGYEHLPGANMVAEGNLVMTEHTERWKFHTGEVIDHSFVSSDTGQINSVFQPDALAKCAKVLRANGFTEQELAKLFKINPAKILGLTPPPGA